LRSVISRSAGRDPAGFAGFRPLVRPGLTHWMEGWSLRADSSEGPFGPAVRTVRAAMRHQEVE